MSFFMVIPFLVTFCFIKKSVKVGGGKFNDEGVKWVWRDKTVWHTIFLSATDGGKYDVSIKQRFPVFGPMKIMGNKENRKILSWGCSIIWHT